MTEHLARGCSERPWLIGGLWILALVRPHRRPARGRRHGRFAGSESVSPRPLQIAVIGSGARDPELAPVAEEVGRRLAEAGAVVVCGGLGGVMEAAARGAREMDGDVIGILPGADPGEAIPHCTHVVAAATGKARNLAVVASADT